jgi:hypothetical protein
VLPEEMSASDIVHQSAYFDRRLDNSSACRRILSVTLSPGMR